MPKKFNAFDPTVALSGTVNISCDPDGTIRMFNESNVTIEFETTFGDYFYLPAWREDVFKIGYRVSQIDWRQFHVIEGQTPLQSSVYGLVYAKDEDIPGTFPQPIQRWVNLGLPVSATLQIQNGTSFPSSPLNNDVFYRSDRRIMYFYDSSLGLWLSTDEIPILWSRIDTSGGLQPYTATLAIESGVFDLRYNVFLTNVSFSTSASLLSAGVNYWTWSLDTVSAGGGVTTRASLSNDGDTSGVNVQRQVNLAASTSDPFARISIVKVGAPGGLFIRATGWYRKVG